MKVYVLIGDMGYDGSYLMGVYSSRELAEKAFQQHPNTKYMDIEIQEREIDEPADIH